MIDVVQLSAQLRSDSSVPISSCSATRSRSRTAHRLLSRSCATVRTTRSFGSCEYRWVGFDLAQLIIVSSWLQGSSLPADPCDSQVPSPPLAFSFRQRSARSRTGTSCVPLRCPRRRHRRRSHPPASSRTSTGPVTTSTPNERLGAEKPRRLRPRAPSASPSSALRAGLGP